MDKKNPNGFVPCVFSIMAEYRGIETRMGLAKAPYKPASEAKTIFAAVRQGDGKYNEAIAAVMWHCGISEQEAEEAVKQTNEDHEFDLEFQPSNYFSIEDPKMVVVSKIKGQLRKEIIAGSIGKEPVPDELVKSELKKEIREVLGRIDPWNMGGEYLPDFLENELEIARVILKSATLDVYSLRAQKLDDQIGYRIVDEYDDYEFILPMKVSKNPLTMREVAQNLNECEKRFTGVILEDAVFDPFSEQPGIVKQHLLGQFEYNDSVEQAMDFVTVESAFYPQLSNYMEHIKVKWVEEYFGST